MNEHAKAWVAALRSGKYEQAKGRLRSPGNHFCCLGVACELAVAAGVIPAAEWSPDREEWTYGGKSGTLPPVVRNWLGLRREDGGYKSGPTSYGSLSGLNDAGGSFKRIAYIIESEPQGLFS